MFGESVFACADTPVIIALSTPRNTTAPQVHLSALRAVAVQPNVSRTEEDLDKEIGQAQHLWPGHSMACEWHPTESRPPVRPPELIGV